MSEKVPRRSLGMTLVASHVMVAMLALLSSAVLVGVLAPRLFDEVGNKGLGQGRGGPGRGGGAGGAGFSALRPEIVSALEQALIWGALLGILAAIALGLFASRAVIKPVDGLRHAARRIARGEYEAPLPSPKTREMAELVGDVRSMSEQLGELEGRRTRLLSEVGHEMRTPLTVIDAQVEAMLDGVRPATPENLALIASETRKLRRLSSDFSLLSRVEEGRVALDLRPLQLGDVAHTTVERLRPQAQDAGIELSIDAGTPLPVSADADRLAQILSNLIGNAIRATSEGGQIKVSTRRDGSDAVVEVSDSGEGLAEADLERIFERFYRPAGRRATACDDGSGIGLTIARQLAAQHGGSLTASSPGKGLGATFILRLPLVA